MVLIFGYKGPSGFSAKSTAEDVTEGINGTGLTAIVTGPTSGIGQETARVLALRGVHVVMAVRNIDSGRIIKHAFSKEMPDAKVDVMVLDISSQASVRKFASDFISSGLPLNILIVGNLPQTKIIAFDVGSLNAGTLAPPYTLSKDDIEIQFATNYLGHFLLTNLLLETMKNTARKSRIEGRIVSVSSELHKSSYMEGIRFDKINDKASYRPMAAYGQSALAKVIHTTELARRLREERVEITANSLHPGVIATNIGRHSTFMAVVFNGLLRKVLKSIPQGAATTCYLALNSQVKGVSGEYFADSNISVMSRQGKDPGMAKKLWDISISMTNTRWTAKSRR